MRRDTFTIAADLTHGEPLALTGEPVQIPGKLVEVGELIYRVASAPDFMPGDLLIVEPRENKAATAEMVIASKGACFFVGRWWQKHGKRELQADSSSPIRGNLRITGAVTLVVRPG